MPSVDQEEFKFPDEKQPEPAEQGVKAAEDTLEVEIEDDTPAEDRGRTPLPKPLVEELEKDDLDTYDDRVKNKLKQMRKVWHDERREKEAALREQQEAVTVAQRLLEENKKLKTLYSNNTKQYAETAKNAAELEVEAAKRAYKAAYEAGDADKLVEAQQALQTANLRLIGAKNYKPVALQEENIQVQPQQPTRPSTPQPDQKALAWQERNGWFGQDEEMTASALGLHEKLRRQGVQVGSDEYYAALDNTMRKRFPEYFDGGEVVEEKSEAKQVTKAKPSTVVAPATRSTSPNKVRLKATQVQLAKKLGLTPEQYARELIKMESRNG